MTEVFLHLSFISAKPKGRTDHIYDVTYPGSLLLFKNSIATVCILYQTLYYLLRLLLLKHFLSFTHEEIVVKRS